MAHSLFGLAEHWDGSTVKHVYDVGSEQPLQAAGVFCFNLILKDFLQKLHLR